MTASCGMIRSPSRHTGSAWLIISSWSGPTASSSTPTWRNSSLPRRPWNLLVSISQDHEVQPLPHYTDAIANFPCPANIEDMRSWFGLVNQVTHYGWLSDIMAPLRPFLSPKHPFTWTPELEDAFQHSKSLIIESRYLTPLGLHAWTLTGRRRASATSWDKSTVSVTPGSQTAAPQDGRWLLPDPDSSRTPRSATHQLRVRHWPSHGPWRPPNSSPWDARTWLLPPTTNLWSKFWKTRPLTT